jgi:GNAT superfamily N-acetyltransferase
MQDAIEIRAFEKGDLDAIVALSLRAWEPVFASLREVLGDPIFFRLKPDWKAAQAEEVTASCTSEDRDAFVALVDGQPVGFVTVALNAFNEGMGVIEIIGVDPAFQRQGIASRLSERALDHMRACGMDIAAVGTGGDPGHAPARAAYEALGFTLLPSARYLKLLEP